MVQLDADGLSVPNWGPAYIGGAISKSDSTNLTPFKIRGLWIGGTGDLVIIFANDVSNGGAGTPVTYFSVPAGVLLPFAVKRVMAATTATNIAWVG